MSAVLDPVQTFSNSHGLDDQEWCRLLDRINRGECTPVIGSGACTGPPIGYEASRWYSEIHYPQSEQLAREWAIHYDYPLDDASHGIRVLLKALQADLASMRASSSLGKEDQAALGRVLDQVGQLYSAAEDVRRLERVAQYLAIDSDGFSNPMFVKTEFSKRFETLACPDFNTIANEPHRVLARLPFSVYLTSNFDNWMESALKCVPGKSPCVAICPWNKHIKNVPLVEPDFDYTEWAPLVYHFHGRTPYAESAVLTEDDFFQFLLNMARDDKLLAHRVDRAIGGGSLLFLGYSLSDWHFLVLFRLLADNLRESQRTHIAVQLAPLNGGESEKQRRAVKYLSSYFRNLNVKVYWGSCQEFCHELRERWRNQFS
jgi:hypothetical protein